MVASQTAFAVNDTLVKLSSGSIETAQIMALRGVMTTTLLVGLALWFGALLPWRQAFHRAVMWRALADIGTTIAYITALRHMPLANTTAIFQALPLTITLLAAVFLRERVGWRRWCAIAVGFVGVLIIVRPDTEGFNIYAVWVILSVLSAALRDLVTRAMPVSIPSLHVACITAGAVCLTGFAWLPAAGWQPMTPTLWTMLAVAAVAVGTGYVLIVLAVRLGDMSFVAPFRYSVLLSAFVLGVLVFAEMPGPSALLGSAIVVASGAYMIRRETRRGIKTAAEAEVP
ncbi:DMT family transporter [Aureimonas sp. AU4]|uniref:DMT family transporter n=1 Tax=Aureimonas sp. AU4 TaxID=1638163 RepID=UPI000783DB78|nr:DMT family transporter [Aureimonas sp. AU4]